MQPFTKHTGMLMPLDRVNVDTDQMVPKQFLKALTREGFGRILFYDWRYFNPGERPNPDFVMNFPRYKGASVLLARANFGCGATGESDGWGDRGTFQAHGEGRGTFADDRLAESDGQRQARARISLRHRAVAQGSLN